MLRSLPLLFLIFSFQITLYGQHNLSCDECLEKAKPQFNSVWLHASAEVSDQHISGLLLLKIMDEDSVFAIFTTQTGATLFEYLITPAKNISLQAAGPFKRKAIRRRLMNDIRHFLIYMPSTCRMNAAVGGIRMVETEFQKEKVVYETSEDCSVVTRIASFQKGKPVMRHFLGEKNGGIPEKWEMKHQKLPFSILLTKLQG